MMDGTTPCSSSCGGFGALFWPLLAPAFTCNYPLTDIQIEKQNLTCKISPRKDSSLHPVELHGQSLLLFLSPEAKPRVTFLAHLELCQPWWLTWSWWLQTPSSSLMTVSMVDLFPAFRRSCRYIVTPGLPQNDMIAVSESWWATRG